MESQYEQFRARVIELPSVLEAITIFFDNTPRALPLKAALNLKSNITRTSLDDAISWAAARQRLGRTITEKLGMIRPDFPDGIYLGHSLRPGQIIWYEDCTPQVVSIEIPYASTVIEEHERQKRWIYGKSVVNFPRNYIQPIDCGDKN